MTNETPEITEDIEPRQFEVSILVHPMATSPTEAYLMTVDSLIRYGIDAFHPLIVDTETGDRFLLTPDGTLVTGEQMQAALEKIQAALDEESADGSSD